MIYWIAWSIMFPIVHLFLPTKIIGKRYIKSVNKKPAIYCSNHQTNNDVLIHKIRVKATTKIMAKKSLFKNKFFGWFLKKCGAYPVERGSTDIGAVKTTLKYLKEGKQLLIFPEGTRVKNAESVDLKTGVVTFALKTDAYIVPTYFKKITKAFVRNTLLVGKPFKFSELEEFRDKKIDKDLIAKANEILTAKLTELKNADPKEYKKQLKLEKKNLN